MKYYKTPLIASLVLSFLFGCSGSRPTVSQYNIRSESSVYDTVLRKYSYENVSIPSDLKEKFKLRKSMGNRETFSQFVENIDRADGINDNFINGDGLVRFLRNEAFDELDREVEGLNGNFEE